MGRPFLVLVAIPVRGKKMSEISRKSPLGSTNLLGPAGLEMLFP